MLGNLHVRFGVGAGVKLPGLHHFILAQSGQGYVRLRFHVGPGGDLELPVRVDYTRPFIASNHAAWHEEYLACVENADPLFLAGGDLRLQPNAVHLPDPGERRLVPEMGQASCCRPGRIQGNHGGPSCLLTKTVFSGKRISCPANG